MKVTVQFFAILHLIQQMDSAVFEQIINVASLLGIVKYDCCMPDGHSGYGFPIGGVAAMNTQTDVISPGGIGFEINCRMRLVKTNLTLEEMMPHIHSIVNLLFENIPTRVGSIGFLRLNLDEFSESTSQGSKWCLKKVMLGLKT